MDELLPVREHLFAHEDDFGFWFNDAVVLMVREGTYFAAARPGHMLPDDMSITFDVDEMLRRVGIAPDALGEGY